METLTNSGYMPFIILSVIVTLCTAFNTIFTAMQNSRKISQASKEPFQRIDKQMDEMRDKCSLHVKELDERIDTIERRINMHDTALKDLHDGQAYMCRGVQALLDHTLNDGNEDEIRAARDSIGKWLRTR